MLNGMDAMMMAKTKAAANRGNDNHVVDEDNGRSMLEVRNTNDPNRPQKSA